MSREQSAYPSWKCSACDTTNDLLRSDCRNCFADRPCRHYDGARGRHCGRTPVHMYVNGPMCDEHRPGNRRGGAA